MRILCTGDFHLGAGADYGRAPGDRLRDQEAAVEQIAELAKDEGVDAVLFAGDAFERRTPTPVELMVWRYFVETLERIPLVAIAGNHDVASADLPTGMEVVRLGGQIRQPGIVRLVNGPAIALLPWTPPARLVAARSGGDRDDLHAEVAEHLLATARDLRAQIDGPAILLAHWSVSGASLPNGLPVDQLREPVLDRDELASQGWDAIVLGHIHKAEVLHEGPPIFYVGSPMPLNFGESAIRHGVWLLETETMQRRFVDIESRPFVTVDVDLTKDITPTLAEFALDMDITDVLAASVAEHFPLTDAVVRIRYRATPEQARRVDQAALRGLVADAGAHKLYAIQPTIVRSDRVRVEGMTETLAEHQALDHWIAANDIDGKAESLRGLHERYMEAVRA